MEKTRRGIMVPVDIGWNDVGSWSALWEYHDKDTDGNVTRGQALLHDVQNSYVSAERRLVALWVSIIWSLWKLRMPFW
jgi:mannose-1-phosphate guanylyltransferase/mannose-6-phosphate isomerase